MSGGPRRDLAFRLLAITDAGRPDLLDAVRAVAAAGGGRVAVLLRDPALGADELRRRIDELLPACRAEGARLLLHGDPRLARETGADGVHLPERGPSVAEARALVGPGALVGASRHDAAGIETAANADYATLSPIFATPGKGAPLGIRAFAEACRSAPLPLVALGGVTPERAAACRAAGALAVAAIRAIWTGDPGRNTRRLLAAWDG